MSCYPGDRDAPGSTRQLQRQSRAPGRSKTIKLPPISQAPQLSDVNNSSRRLQARSRQLIVFIKFMFLAFAFFFYFFFALNIKVREPQDGHVPTPAPLSIEKCVLGAGAGTCFLHVSQRTNSRALHGD